MAKTIILGNSHSAELASKLDATLIEVPDIYENDWGVVNDFVIDKLHQEFDVLVIDADNIQRPDVALAIGMYLRLSVVELMTITLLPIIVASDKGITSFLKKGTYSQLLLTSNVYFQARTNIIVDAVQPLDAQNYKNGFLDCIHIQPGPEVGRHSLANQWGASVIDRIINNGKPSDNPVLKTAAKSLYYKYIYALSIDVVGLFSEKKQIQYALTPKTPIDARGKHLLLIDDEASKGWEYVLKQLVSTNDGDFEVITHKAKDYLSLTNEERDRIKSGVYDLIFLDLRMNGLEEDEVYKPEEFSGMKILKQIKKSNSGTQVIMFTASNKAWNLKALLDAGADGYYIKESPEYKFSPGFSYANYEALRNNIKDCLSRSYLKKVDSKIKDIAKDFNIAQTPLKTSIINQLGFSYSLLRKQHFEFAYISLYQVIEMINSEYLDRGTNWYIVPTGKDAKSWAINFRHECEEAKFSADDKRKFPEWKKAASLYYQLWKQKDKTFGYKLQWLINERNKFMHNDCEKQSIIHSEKGYLELFDVITTMCSYL